MRLIYFLTWERLPNSMARLTPTQATEILLPDCYVLLIASILRDRTFCVRLDGTLSRETTVTAVFRSPRQGGQCVPSPVKGLSVCGPPTGGKVANQSRNTTSEVTSSRISPIYPKTVDGRITSRLPAWCRFCLKRSQTAIGFAIYARLSASLRYRQRSSHSRLFYWPRGS